MIKGSYNPEWIENPYPFERWGVLEKLCICPGNLVDVRMNTGKEFHEASALMVFCGPGIITHYRMSSSNFQIQLSIDIPIEKV